MQFDKIHEECGVFGVYSKSNCDVASTVYYGLFALQHRGQESCGIVVDDDGLFNSYKDVGIVNDVFTPERLKGLGFGNIAIGHVRYGTTGSNDRANAQPIVVNHIKGRMALAHNGQSRKLVGAEDGTRNVRLYFSYHKRYRSHILCDNQGASFHPFDRRRGERRHDET